MHLLEPFEGTRHETIDIARLGRCARIVVFEPDHRTPAAGVTVQVRRAAIGSAQHEAFAEVKTDRQGTAQLTDLGAGSYWLQTDGVLATDPPPLTRRFLLTEMFPGQHVLAVLVRKQPCQSVTFAVTATGIAELLPPKLFVRRIDRPADRWTPQTTVVANGQQEFTIDLPVGDYLLDVLPQGRLAVAGHDGTIRVREDSKRFQVSVNGDVPQTTVRLLGIGPEHRSLRVLMQRAEDQRWDDPDLAFAGALHWHLPEAQLAVTDTPHWFMALTRAAAFLSERPVVCSGPTTDVPMREATCLRVVWYEWDPAVDEDGVLEATVGDTSTSRHLRHILVPTPGGPRPALGGCLFVPTGLIRATLFRRDGRVAWQREVAAKPPDTWLVID
ncbi:MAG: hypothetical protein IPK26_28480 [Planctomycetes bacterium]|nr:hypothetical protein [Planctomycetota bacterium]